MEQVKEEKEEKESLCIDGYALDAIVRLTAACSKDVTREHLRQVHIFDGIAFATDGHIACWAPVQGPRVSINADALKKFKGTLAIYFNDTEVSDGFLTFKTGAVSEQLVTLFRGFIAYPEKSAAVDKQELDHTVGINAELLFRAQKALVSKKGHGLKLVIKDRLSPIQLYYQGDMRGVIMPMRV